MECKAGRQGERAPAASRRASCSVERPAPDLNLQTHIDGGAEVYAKLVAADSCFGKFSEEFWFPKQISCFTPTHAENWLFHAVFWLFHAIPRNQFYRGIGCRNIEYRNTA